MTNQTRLANAPDIIINCVYLRTVNVINKDATISTTIERHSERLETLLSSGVPQLHGNKSVVYHHFLCQAEYREVKGVSKLQATASNQVFSQVCANSGLVLVAEPLVDILVHQRCLSHTAIAKNDDLKAAV